MATVALNEFASVTLDGTGGGTARVGPRAHGVVWRPTVASLKVSGTITNSPTCTLYVGSSATDDNVVDGTYTGELNSTDAVTGSELRLGAYVWAVWSGGDAGHQATLSVTGTAEIGGA